MKGEVPFARAIEWIVGEGLTARESGVETQGTGDRGRGTACGQPRATLGIAEPRARGAHRPLSRLKLRPKPKRTDAAAVRSIVAATGLFREAEVDVAEELVQTRLKKGAKSGYEFVFAEEDKEVVGYICFGRNALTVSSFDVYWIAVQASQQGRGIGKLLLEEAEKQIAAAGGSRIYIETSHRADYQATRGFYERCGYELAAVLEDFYAPGDGKATYVKTIAAAAASAAGAMEVEAASTAS
jgi:ribosomal protein S18 acetylase RimI-like enzyme